LTASETREIDPEDEDSARLLLNLQDDVAIAVAKIIKAYENDDIDEDEAMGSSRTSARSCSPNPTSTTRTR